MDRFDAVVVGGGPAGSTCARFLTASGLRVAVLDRARFPRVKLCAGWLTGKVWDVLERPPESFPGGLWPWSRCHVQFGGRRHSVAAKGYFIRRYEFDDWLLSQSGAEVIQHSAKKIIRDGNDWVVDDVVRAPYIVGAGGTHCPVARALFPKKPRRPAGAQELEFEANPGEIAATRVGDDGEPELLLHQDLRGYSWNIPKTQWLNVGCGTLQATDVRDAWSHARSFFQGDRHLPESAATALDRAKGHSYYLFDPAHLAQCEREGALLVGDSLGLAQPLTAEGILPAILSGRLAAEAIASGDSASYTGAMRKHPTMVDYVALYRMREGVASLRARATSGPPRKRKLRAPNSLKSFSHAALATGFAWMFSGNPLPARPLVKMIGRVR